MTTPFDVAKTRAQIDGGSRAPRIGTVVRRIAAEDGWTGLFRGAVPRVVRTAPSCAIMIGSYEVGKLYFTHQQEQLEL